MLCKNSGRVQLKVCSRCKAHPAGSNGYCRDCKNKYQFEWRKKNPQKSSPEYLREWHKKNPGKRRRYQKKWELAHPGYRRNRVQQKGHRYKYKYGLSLEEVGRMLHSQANSCATCKTPLTKPQVDHCHRTGMVRGILCFRCNIVLGRVDDDVKILRSLAKYVESFASSSSSLREEEEAK